MTRIVLPACLYALSVFAVGFALGTVRVLLVAPRLGEPVAVAVELPLMIAVSVLLAARILRRWQVPRAVPARLVLGALAFVVLIACEVAVSALVFGNPPAGNLTRARVPADWIGLAGQVGFALVPVLLLLRRNDP